MLGQVRCGVLVVALLTLFSPLCVHSRLSDIVRHFEPLKYDAKQFMATHHTAKRDLEKSQIKLPFKFQAFGRQFNLELYPDDSMFSPDVKFMDQDGEFFVDRSGLYSGRSKTAQPTYVTGHIYHDVFTGVIVTRLETYVIEPAHLHFNTTQYFHSVIYKESDVKPVRGKMCGISEEKVTDSDAHGIPTLTNLFSERGIRMRRTLNVQRRTCSVLVDLEDKFVNDVTSPSQSDTQKRAVAMGQVAIHLNLMAGIFSTTTFSIYPDPGVFIIVPLVIINLSQESRYSDNFLGSGAYLELFSQVNHDEYCLAYKFTHREFDGGVLGLAYVGTDRFGGICGKFSGTRGINTGIVTTLNFGRTVSLITTSLTFTHELGHNFGSSHDTGVCINQPGGNYIMSPQANPGDQPNNRLFSSCSIAAMTPVIEARGSDDTNGCFEARTGVAFCGNGIVEEGEECDCGFSAQCNDPCCIADTCLRVANVQCSPSEGPCCQANCSFTRSGSQCLATSDCAFAARCSGMNATCPTPAPRANTTLCNNNMSICFNGICSSSYCLFNRLEDCEIISDNGTLLCELACTTNTSDPSACISTFKLAMLPNSKIEGRAQVVGGLCNGTEGYCDEFGVCRATDDEGPITRLTNLLFNAETLQSIQQYITTYWWAVMLGAIALIVLLVIMTWVCSVVPLPSLRKMKNRKENLSAAPPKKKKNQPAVVVRAQ